VDLFVRANESIVHFVEVEEGKEAHDSLNKGYLELGLPSLTSILFSFVAKRLQQCQLVGLL
jgi:hypothetical protein